MLLLGCCGWFLGHYYAVARLLWVADLLSSCYSEWLPGSCYAVARLWSSKHPSTLYGS